MSKNMIYKYDEKKTRVRVLPATVQSGTPLFDPSDQRPAIALTASGDATKTVTNAEIPMGGGVTTLTYPNGGASLYGTWELDVFSTGTTPAPTSTANGVQVYLNAGQPTLNSSGGTAFGRVDYPTDYFKRAGKLPVRIGD